MVISARQIKECVRTELLHVIEQEIDEGLNKFFNSPTKFADDIKSLYTFNILKYDLSITEVEHIKTLYSRVGWEVNFSFPSNNRKILTFKIKE